MAGSPPPLRSLVLPETHIGLLSTANQEVGSATAVGQRNDRNLSSGDPGLKEYIVVRVRNDHHTSTASSPTTSFCHTSSALQTW